MNLKVLSWLVKHRDLLAKVVAVVKRFDKNGTIMEKWALVDEVARIVIPVIQDNEEVLALLAVGYTDYDDDSAVSFALGADVAALGVDWKLVMEVILPVIISILEAITCGRR